MTRSKDTSEGDACLSRLACFLARVRGRAFLNHQRVTHATRVSVRDAGSAILKVDARQAVPRCSAGVRPRDKLSKADLPAPGHSFGPRCSASARTSMPGCSSQVVTAAEMACVRLDRKTHCTIRPVDRCEGVRFGVVPPLA